MAKSLAELYAEDFYAWTQDQATAIRELQGINRLDVEHLAEEVADLGRSELNAALSFAEQIVVHLLKLDYSRQPEPRPHWRAEVAGFRASFERVVTPTIRRKIEADLDGIYRRACRTAAAASHVHEPDLARRFPKTCPYDWPTIWQRDVFAEAGFDLPDSSGS